MRELKVLALLAQLAVASAVSIRDKRAFNVGWRFHLGATPSKARQHLPELYLSASGSESVPQYAQPSYDDSFWRTLSVPHDFVVEGTFTPTSAASHGFLPTDAAWYRKWFSLPADWDADSVAWIEFDGVYRASDVYLNGHFLGHHDSGYTSFQLTLPTAITKFGPGSKNLLAVYCDARHQEGWWYEGGGIYRHVWLHRAARIHVPPYGVYAPALVTGAMSPDGKSATSAELRAKIEVRNTLAKSVTVSINTEVTPSHGIDSDADGSDTEHRLNLAPAAAQRSRVRVMAGGKRLGTTVAVGPNETAVVDMVLEMDDVRLWSPEQPAMYSLRTIISDSTAGSELDVVHTRFGVRKVEFNVADGFVLNGVSRKIKGMCNHQDFAGTGTAVPMGLQRFRIQRMQAMGANGWRMSHNPPNPELLDMLDEQGMLVWDENRNFGDDPVWLQDFADMLRRDRNHPSIVLWSICNEAGCDERNDTRAAAAAVKFKAVLAQHDPHGQRPMAAAMNSAWGTGVSRVIDVQGINYAYGQFDTYRKSHPKQPLIGSETASCTTDRGVYVGGVGYAAAYPSLRERGCELNDEGEVRCRGTTCLQDWVIPVMSKPWVAGGFGWTGFDYKGEPTPDQWPTVNSHYGAAFDMAGLEKDAFWYYKAWWTADTAVLHVFPHWNWEAPHAFPNATIPVRVYTNAASVRLALNGQWVSDAQAVAQYVYATFDVAYVPGNLTAVGYAASGAVWATTSVVTSGQARRLEGSLLWGGHDGKGVCSCLDDNVALVEVQVQDEHGVLVPWASNLVHFAVTDGSAVVVGVGNGDPSSHEPDKAQRRSAFMGKAVAVVQLPVKDDWDVADGGCGSGGQIVVEASSDGLASAHVTIPVRGCGSSDLSSRGAELISSRDASESAVERQAVGGEYGRGAVVVDDPLYREWVVL